MLCYSLFVSSSVRVVLLSCFRRIKRIRPPWEIKCVDPHSWCRLQSVGQSTKPDSGLSVDRTVHRSRHPNSTPPSLLGLSASPRLTWRAERPNLYTGSNGAAFNCCGNFPYQTRVSELSQIFPSTTTRGERLFSWRALNECRFGWKTAMSKTFSLVVDLIYFNKFNKFQYPTHGTAKNRMTAKRPLCWLTHLTN